MSLKNVPTYEPHDFVFGSRHRGTDICGVCELPRAQCIVKYQPRFERVAITACTGYWLTRVGREPVLAHDTKYSCPLHRLPETRQHDHD